MKHKDYRELQISSSQLAVIFFGVLILGAVIFLLGVSVGKKQAQIIKETNMSSDAAIEKPEEPKIKSEQEQKETIRKESASRESSQKPEESKPSAKGRKNLYYIQVGAFNNRNSANSYAETYKDKEYPALVFAPFPSDRRPIYRVRIGGYETKEEAERELQKLMELEKKKRSDFLIIRY